MISFDIDDLSWQRWRQRAMKLRVSKLTRWPAALASAPGEESSEKVFEIKVPSINLMSTRS